MKSILSVVPVGYFCYSDKGTCPYHEVVETRSKKYRNIDKPVDVSVRARCNLVNEEDEYVQDIKLLWDQCKLCSVNNFEDYESNVVTSYKPFELLFSGVAC
jgi:hypothetical protein